MYFQLQKVTVTVYLMHFLLQVMIFLVDRVLPESYFANNLRALSVDMAVFRDLLRSNLPQLSKHLGQLQSAACDLTTGTTFLISK